MTTLPHTFKRIRLNLARSKEFPQRLEPSTATSSSHRSTPRDISTPRCGGRIATIAACAASGRARTTRSASVVHKPGGAEHGRWVFDYDADRGDDDESGYRFGAHAFRPGEYVSIRDDEGEMHTFQVASVEPAA